MAKKSQLLLLKRAFVEAALLAQEQRNAAQSTALAKQAEGPSIFQQMRSDWEALTQMRIQNGTAIIPLRGVITPDDPFASYYGETSLVAFSRHFAAALADPAVKGILINAFSPGGLVYGVEAAGNAIYAARGQKPIVAYTDSLAASAAYWLISAADKIVLAGDTAEVGSIGVYLAHFDYSGMLEDMGINVTEITAGEFKGTGSPYAPLSKEDKANLQAEVDHVYTQFVSTVARNRGLAIKDVLKSANGLTFFGADAVKHGLADGIATFQEAIQMAQGNSEGKPQEGAGTGTGDSGAAAQAALATEQEKNKALEAELATYRAKEAAAEKKRLAAECNDAFKSAFGREATAEEQTVYANADEHGRKLLIATLNETATNRDKLIKAANLDKEVATSGPEADTDTSKSPLVLAAQRLGLAVVK